MVFQDDLSVADGLSAEKEKISNKSDEHGSLIIKVLNEKQTRQGKIFEVNWCGLIYTIKD